MMKKIFAGFLILTLILCCAFPALAITKTQDGLEVTVSTDKKDYREGDVIRISLSVKNTGNNPVYDVQAEYKLPSGLILPDGASGTVAIGTIAPGQSKTLFKDFPVITKQQIVNLPKTGDSSDSGLLALIGAGALLMILIIKKEQRKRLFALLLCCALMGNAFGRFNSSASAEEKYIPATLEAYEDITLNGNPESAGVVLSYKKLPENIPVASITLDKQSVTLSVGECEQLSASVQPGDATNQEIEWTSGDSKIASVDAAGKITAIAPGTATITATAKDGSGASTACEVTVENPNRCGNTLYWQLGQDGVLKIYGQGDMYSTYLAADQLPWHALRSQIQSVVIGENTTGIADYSFYGCINLAEVSLPDSLKRMGSSAFSGCTALAEMTIPSGISELPDELFDGCSSLRRVKLPKQITKIGRRAFADCVSLSSITEY